MRENAFVQNTITKEGYQLKIAMPAPNTGLEVAPGTGNKSFSILNPVRSNKVEILIQ